MQKNSVKVVVFRDKYLGSGSYGQVFLGRKYNESNGNDNKDDLVAVKVIGKREIMATDSLQRLQFEKKTLLACKGFSFVVDLLRTFCDEENVYLVFEYIPGGTLYWHKQRAPNHSFPIRHCLFYSAELVVILKYLHKTQNILYGDLKPENLMIDMDGHLKLIDMGSARILINDEDKSKSVCGTPLYSAPEVLIQDGYSNPADIWSYGALLYDLVFGLPPFADRNNNNDNNDNNGNNGNNNSGYMSPLQIYRRAKQPQEYLIFPIDEIIERNLNYLDGKTSMATTEITELMMTEMLNNFKDLILKLLVVDPNQRLTIAEIQNSPWFINSASSPIDFTAIANKTSKGPIIPILKDINDLTYHQSQSSGNDNDLTDDNYEFEQWKHGIQSMEIDNTLFTEFE